MQPDHQAILDQYLEYAQRCATVECAERAAAQTRRQLQTARDSIKVAEDFNRQVLEPVIAAFEARAEKLRSTDG